MSFAAYIGPGAGIALAGALLELLIAIVLGVLALVVAPAYWVRAWWRRLRRPSRGAFRRVIIIGLDGLDPTLTQRWLAEGRLPHLADLARQGLFTPLGTTLPAISPTAWSSFSTGVWPEKHGVFDFISLDRLGYRPELSSSRVEKNGTVIRLRRGVPWWVTLTEQGWPAVVLRVPITFPPDRFAGRLLSGMCVPDARGTQGTYTVLTTARSAVTDRHVVPAQAVAGVLESPHLSGETVTLSWRDPGRTATGRLPGPQGLSAPIRLTRDVHRGRVWLELGGRGTWLQPDVYSNWLTVAFEWGWIGRVTAICRALLLAIEPEVRIYLTPLMVDPKRPMVPISQPRLFSPYLAALTGPFATLGLAEDTWALNDGVISPAAFLRQCADIQDTRERALFQVLRDTSEGAIVAVFDAPDRIQHMWWREAQTGDPVIRECYERCDRLVGAVRRMLRPDDLLWVMSDHGFAGFARQVGLNAWLRDQGYLALRSDADPHGDWLTALDWATTRVFALGLGGLYLNLKGREAHGCVDPGAAGELCRELAQKLLAWRDADNNDVPVIRRVVAPAIHTPGPFTDRAPDLLVGYAPGYRVSWTSARGGVDPVALSDNPRRWSGDHAVDPDAVPGVFFSSAPLTPPPSLPAQTPPRIVDLAPTLLRLFGVTPPANYDGQAYVPAQTR